VENDPLAFSWFTGPDLYPFAFGELVTIELEVGVHTVTVLVDDGTDTSAASILFEIITPSVAVEHLILQVNESGLERPRKRPLIATLKAACASFERGSFDSGLNQLKAFQNKVQAQVARHNPALGELWIRTAQEIIENIGLSPERVSQRVPMALDNASN
jgi:hypothetical protein